MSAKVTGLGHIGFYVHDLELMMDFYENFMGMTKTKVGPLGAFFRRGSRRAATTRLP